jgi:hypothetical protein
LQRLVARKWRVKDSALVLYHKLSEANGMKRNLAKAWRHHGSTCVWDADRRSARSAPPPVRVRAGLLVQKTWAVVIPVAGSWSVS